MVCKMKSTNATRLQFSESPFGRAVMAPAIGATLIVGGALIFLFRYRSHGLIRASSLELSFALLFGTHL